MVISGLDSSLISGGEMLLRQLDKRNVQVDAALWLFYPDTAEWKLLLSFPEVAAQGPKSAYRMVQDAFPVLGDMPFSLDDIVVTRADSPLLRLLRKAITVGPGISGVKFSGNVVDGQLIQDAYIYRLMRADHSSTPRAKPALHLP